MIDRDFPLAHAAEAHRRMEAGEHVGKIVLEIPSSRDKAFALGKARDNGSGMQAVIYGLSGPALTDAERAFFR